MQDHIVGGAVPESAQRPRHHLAHELVGFVGVVRELTRLGFEFAVARQDGRYRLRHGRSLSASGPFVPPVRTAEASTLTELFPRAERKIRFLATFLEGGANAAERKPLLSALGRNEDEPSAMLDGVQGSAANEAT